MAGDGTAQAFGVRTVIGMVVAGILAFASFLVLAAYAGDFRGRSDGRAHALSIGATGYAGLVKLAGALGETPLIVREPDDLRTDDLLVIALTENTETPRLADLIEQRGGKVTLLILPKWAVGRHPTRPGWVQKIAPVAPDFAKRALKNVVSVSFENKSGATPGAARGRDVFAGVSLAVPGDVQTIAGPALLPMLTTPGGTMILAQVEDRALYILADPDIMNNHGLRDPRTARAAIDILERLNATDAESIAFDVTLNGFGRTPNGLRLIFEPPFVVLTLALFGAAVLAGLHGAVRFGPERRPARLIAFGKAALVENSAALIRMARREHRAGTAYAELIREATARDTGAASLPPGTDLDAYFDRVSKADAPFSALAAGLRDATDRAQLLAAARALYLWKKDVVR